MIYAKLWKTVPHCPKLCQTVINLCKMSETYLLGHSLVQFYTVKHTYARLITKIISTRDAKKVRISNFFNYLLNQYSYDLYFYSFN